MAIDTKTDLIKEIEAFSKALYDYSEIGDEIIAILNSTLIIQNKEF